MQAPAFHLPEGESFQSLPVFWDHTEAEIDCKRCFCIHGPSAVC